MAKLSIKTGDNVVVIAGKDSGKTGKVMAASPKTGRVIVEGVNIISRHTKPKSAQDQGGIIKHEGPISASNVMIICPACGKATRVHHKEVDGKVVRVCKCGEVLDRKYVKEAKKADKSVKAEKPAKEEKVAKTEATAEVKAPAKKASTKKATPVKKEVATKTNKTTAQRAVRKTQKDV